MKRFAVMIGLVAVGLAGPARADDDTDKAALVASAMQIYAGRAALPKHVKAAEAFAALAEKYPQDKQRQVWCSRTAYYAAHRIDDSGVKAKVAGRGVDCAKRIIAMNKADYEGRFWWLMTRFQAEQARGVTKALGAAPQITGLLSKMIKDHPKRAEAYMVLGAIYRGLPGPPISIGDQDKALDLLEQSAKLAPDNAEVLLELAQAYADMGQKDKARATYRHCIDKGTGPANLEWETQDAKDYAKKMLAQLD
ncbi:MAG: tetratricopeptide repeat protein [Deltaproteobacteria bacterium]|nr:tetratricopeptide repeat protein [Deltaproteobacteria bacterium]MCB9786266.1 tetratricopeptide repeat protein [Deltaproteobacteria bacterium]